MCECNEAERLAYLDKVHELTSHELSEEYRKLFELINGCPAEVPLYQNLSNRVKWIREYKETLKLLEI